MRLKRLKEEERLQRRLAIKERRQRRLSNLAVQLQPDFQKLVHDSVRLTHKPDPLQSVRPELREQAKKFLEPPK